MEVKENRSEHVGAIILIVIAAFILIGILILYYYPMLHPQEEINDETTTTVETITSSTTKENSYTEDAIKIEVQKVFDLLATGDNSDPKCGLLGHLGSDEALDSDSYFDTYGFMLMECLYGINYKQVIGLVNGNLDSDLTYTIMNENNFNRYKDYFDTTEEFEDFPSFDSYYHNAVTTYTDEKLNNFIANYEKYYEDGYVVNRVYSTSSELTSYTYNVTNVTNTDYGYNVEITVKNGDTEVYKGNTIVTVIDNHIRFGILKFNKL